MRTWISVLVFGIATSYLSAAGPRVPTHGDATPQYILDYNAGLDAQDRKQWAKAMDLYEKSLKESPEFPEALSNYGVCAYQMAEGYLAKAEHNFKKALKYLPGHAEALKYQGKYFIASGKLKLAYKNYEKLLEINKKDAGKLKDNLDDVLENAEDVLIVYKP